MGQSGIPKRILNRYQVGAQLGSDDCSDVFECMDSRVGRRCCIKIVRPEFANSIVFRAHFRRLIGSASRLAHPAIERIYDAGETVVGSGRASRPLLFVVAELIDGRTVRDLLAGGAFDAAPAVRIEEGVLAALEFAQRAGVVHGAIRPEHVMVDRHDRVKVTGFGVALAGICTKLGLSSGSPVDAADADGRVLTAGEGKDADAGPAAARVPIPNDAATNAAETAIGTVAHELDPYVPADAVGREPKPADDVFAAAVLLGAMLKPRPNEPGSAPYVALLRNATAADPAERYQSVAAFRSDLELAVSGVAPQPLPAAKSALGSPQGQASGGIEYVNLPELEIDSYAGPAPSRPARVARLGVAFGVGAAAVAVILGVLFWLNNAQSAQKLPEGIVRVPAVAGLPWDQASNKLLNVGLYPDRVDVTDSKHPAGDAVATEPGANETYQVRNRVKVFVSVGPPSPTPAPSASTAQG